MVALLLIAGVIAFFVIREKSDKNTGAREDDMALLGGCLIMLFWLALSIGAGVLLFGALFSLL